MNAFGACVPGEGARTLVEVGEPEIDRLHAELEQLVELACVASDYNFPKRFGAVLVHTEAHFAREEAMMARIGFPHHVEHITEHRQMLQELRLFGRRSTMARAYVCQRMGERFALHVSRMDSLLADYLRSAAGR